MPHARLDDIFNILDYKKFYNSELISKPGGISYVSTSEFKNGITDEVELVPGVDPIEPEKITVSIDGSILSSFLQTYKFYCSPKVFVLDSKTNMTKEKKLFYCACIESNKFRYNYGRKASKTLGELLVPDELCADEMMKKISISEQYMSDIREFENKIKKIKLKKRSPIDFSDWKKVLIPDIFAVVSGKNDLSDYPVVQGGKTGVVSSTEKNNGIHHWTDCDADFSAPAITVASNGSIGSAFYHDVSFCAISDVNILYPNFNMTSNIALFLCALLEQEKFRYNYGRKWSVERMNDTFIKLPYTVEGNPDWEFIENYMKTEFYC